MRKILALFIFMVAGALALPLQAQIKLGVKGGANITDMKFNRDILKADNRVGFFIGPTVKAKLPIVGLLVDVSALYDQREVKLDDQTVTAKAINVPVNLRYGIDLGQSFSIYAYAGPQFGFNVAEDKSLKKNYEEWKWKESSFSINIGGGITLSNHLEVSANYNVVCGKTGDVTYDTVSDALKAKANAWQVALAFYF